MNREDVGFLSDGDRCAAWLYRPGGPGPHPCVVMAPGFGGIREARLDAYAERFAQAGLAALVFDYRCFGASGGEPRQLLSIGRQLSDWRAAVAFTRSLDGVDPDRVALWGTSFSGGHVIDIASRDARIAAVVAQEPFVDGLRTALMVPPRQAARLTAAGLRDALRAARHATPYRVPVVGPPGSLAAMTTPDAEPGFRALLPPGLPWDDRVCARILLTTPLYSPGRRARSVRCPMLVCVCTEDRTVPVAAALRVAAAAPRGELRRFPIAHFDIYLGEWFERSVQQEIEFLSRHLLHAAVAA